MTDNYERCSCGARYKSKCVEESGSGCGKMCVNDFVPIPEDLLSKIEWIRQKAEVNRLRDQITILDASTAFEMIENPPEANEKLSELLRIE